MSSSFSGLLVPPTISLLRHSLQVRRVHGSLHTVLMVVYTRCRWNVQVITPAVFNVVADVVLFVYPSPIIFMANIPSSLRYALVCIFALCGLVTASAIVRVSLLTQPNFLQQQNIYAYPPLASFSDRSISWWAGIEGAVALLVASLPVLGGRLISRWRHILTRNTTNRSRSFYFRQSQYKSRPLVRNTRASSHSTQQGTQGTQGTLEMASPKFPAAAYLGTEKTVETVISAGSTLTENGRETPEEEPMSLMQHMARMGRRGSRDTHHTAGQDANVVTIRKEVYIKEEQRGEGSKIHEEEGDGSDIV